MNHQNPFLKIVLTISFWVVIFFGFLFAPRIMRHIKYDNSINVCIWSGIIDPQLFKKFEKETGIHVNVGYFDGNEELIVKLLATQGKGYDLVNPSDYVVDFLRQHGLLQRIDKSKLDFYDDLLVILNEQVESGINVVVAGDWNTAHFPIDLANPKANEKNSGFMPVERAQLDEYVENGYVDTFRLFHDEPDRYSWWTYRFGARQRNIGWRIDYFFVNEGFVESVADADIHEDVMGSDHCPVSIELVDNF